VGHGASELVHIGQAALAFEAAVDYFVNRVFNDPTFAEEHPAERSEHSGHK
jgi:NAD(P) transhydrogenase